MSQLVVNNHLLLELSSEIIEADICIRRCAERHIVGNIASICPCVLKNMVIVPAHKLLACREHSDIVDQWSRISESAACICSDHDFINRHIFDCRSGGYLEALSKEPVSAKSCNSSELLTGTECIFSEHSCISQICNSSL